MFGLLRLTIASTDFCLNMNHVERLLKLKFIF